MHDADAVDLLGLEVPVRGESELVQGNVHFEPFSQYFFAVIVHQGLSGGNTVIPVPTHGIQAEFFSAQTLEIVVQERVIPGGGVVGLKGEAQLAGRGIVRVVRKREGLTIVPSFVKGSPIEHGSPPVPGAGITVEPGIGTGGTERSNRAISLCGICAGRIPALIGTQGVKVQQEGGSIVEFHGGSSADGRYGQGGNHRIRRLRHGEGEGKAVRRYSDIFSGNDYIAHGDIVHLDEVVTGKGYRLALHRHLGGNLIQLRRRQFGETDIAHVLGGLHHEVAFVVVQGRHVKSHQGSSDIGLGLGVQLPVQGELVRHFRAAHPADFVLRHTGHFLVGKEDPLHIQEIAAGHRHGFSGHQRVNLAFETGDGCCRCQHLESVRCFAIRRYHTDFVRKILVPYREFKAVLFGRNGNNDAVVRIHRAVEKDVLSVDVQVLGIGQVFAEYGNRLPGAGLRKQTVGICGIRDTDACDDRGKPVFF